MPCGAAEGFGSWGRTRSDGNAASMETSTGGFVIGADTPLGDAFRVGLAGGFARTSFDVSGRLSSGSNESVFGAVYGSGSWGRSPSGSAPRMPGTTSTRAAPCCSRALATSRRPPTMVRTMHAFGEVGYRFGLGRASLEPFVGASILRLHTDAFQEGGGAFALTGYGRDQDLATTTSVECGAKCRCWPIFRCCSRG